MTNIQHTTICEYLYFGYALLNSNGLFVEQCLKSLPPDYGYTAHDAGRLFDIIVDDALARITNRGLLIIPISGGLDSRFLLGAIRERLDSREIKTLTFGVPGQYDYSIGRVVSKALEVENLAIDLSRIEISWEALLDSVHEAPWTCIPFAYFNRQSIERSGLTHASMLSGFLGETLTGSHMSGVSALPEVYSEFIARQQWARTVCLAPADFNPQASLSFLASGYGIDLNQMLDLSIRQANFIGPTVTPLTRWNEWNIQVGSIQSCSVDVYAPYANPAWAAYWLLAPKKYKLGQLLYKQLLEYKFPKLWALPVKYCLGLPPKSTLLYRLAKKKRQYQVKINELFPRLGIAPTAHMNYLDFATAFRKRPDYQALLETAFEYLREHRVVPWLQLSSIKAQHMSGTFNHANVLLVLIGLALNLKNMERTPGE